MLKNLILTFFIFKISLSFFGGGLPTPLIVYDPTNWIQNVQTQLNTLESISNQVKSLSNEATQITNQIKSLENEAKHLKKIGSSLSSGSLQELQQYLQRMSSLQDQMESKLNDYSQISQIFSEIYPDYQDNQGKTFSDYKQNSDNIREEMKKASLDSFRALDIISKENYSNDNEAIEEILNFSNNADGQLQVLQASVQMSSATMKQLQDMKYLTGQTLKLHSTYYAKKEQEEIIQKEEETLFYKDSVDVENLDAPVITEDGKLGVPFK